jgi:hypothetical protein
MKNCDKLRQHEGQFIRRDGMKTNLLIIVLAGALSLVSIGNPAGVEARVEVNIVLPPLVISSPPEVVVIPGTYAYFVPGVEVDIFFYHGYWYRPYSGYWFRASAYNGPWGRIAVSRVPRVLVNVPPDFRHIPPGHQRIPYGQLKKNWRTWERDRYWDRHEEKGRHKEEKREHGEGKGRGKDR